MATISMYALMNGFYGVSRHKDGTEYRFKNEKAMAIRAVACNRRPEYGWKHMTGDGIEFSWEDIQYLAQH